MEKLGVVANMNDDPSSSFSHCACALQRKPKVVLNFRRCVSVCVDFTIVADLRIRLRKVDIKVGGLEFVLR